MIRLWPFLFARSIVWSMIGRRIAEIAEIAEMAEVLSEGVRVRFLFMP